MLCLRILKSFGVLIFYLWLLFAFPGGLKLLSLSPACHDGVPWMWIYICSLCWAHNRFSLLWEVHPSGPEIFLELPILLFFPFFSVLFIYLSLWKAYYLDVGLLGFFSSYQFCIQSPCLFSFSIWKTFLILSSKPSTEFLVYVILPY